MTQVKGNKERNECKKSAGKKRVFWHAIMEDERWYEILFHKRGTQCKISIQFSSFFSFLLSNNEAGDEEIKKNGWWQKMKEDGTKKVEKKRKANIRFEPTIAHVDYIFIGCMT